MNAPVSLTKHYNYPTAFSGWGDEEIYAINRVIGSDKWTMGAECEALEREFAAWHRMRFGIGVNSGSSANLVSVAAMAELGLIKRSDKVMVPTLAWATTYSPLVQYGLDPVLIDADPSWNAGRDADLQHTYNLGNGDKVSLIVACSILGNPHHGGFWKQMADNLGAALLDDNCESIGAREPDGTLCGTRGLANTFSMYFSHQLSAIEGGMILTNDEDFAITCRRMRNHGWSRGTVMPQDFSDEFQFLMHGFNVRPLELHSAIARVQLAKLPKRIVARRANYAHWMAASCDLPIERPWLRGEPSPFAIHFCVQSSAVRQKLANALRANGIDCRPPIAGSFRLQPYGKPWADQRTPVADQIHHRGMAIGCPPFPGEALIDRAVKIMRETL
jgi:CDP-4-dehydro-6-deoxyglucose reductase, E1